jgi:hypothetical protein
MDYRDIEQTLAAAGLLARGGFHPGPGDGAPGNAATLVLVGNAGPALWRAFSKATTEQARNHDRHPLDQWTRQVVGRAAADLGAQVVFPFDGPPYPPFQSWALKAGGVHVSPIGPLIHPKYGLWHAYRGALLFADRLVLPEVADAPSPCDGCAAKPCLTTCPVGAFKPGAGAARARYDVPACVGHVGGARGGDCLGGGCLARRACPVGRDHIYEPAQARFHMRRFVLAQGGKVPA